MKKRDRLEQMREIMRCIMRTWRQQTEGGGRPRINGGAIKWNMNSGKGHARSGMVFGCYSLGKESGAKWKGSAHCLMEGALGGIVSSVFGSGVIQRMDTLGGGDAHKGKPHNMRW